jgi:hypothetical protein
MSSPALCPKESEPAAQASGNLPAYMLALWIAEKEGFAEKKEAGDAIAGFIRSIEVA